mgnify:CR=1 FL=1
MTKNCIIIDRLMVELKNEMKGNEAFLSEGDFQYSFAKTVEKLGGSKVVIEYPYDLDGTRRHADVSFVYEGGRYFVELKYKTRTSDDVCRFGEPAHLAYHAAESDNLYSFYSDIEKMEGLTGNTKSSVAFCIFLTNNPSFWAKHNGVQNSKVSLENESKTNNGSINYSDKKELCIEHQYAIEWKNFKDNESFKYLVIEIKPRTKK